MYRLILVLILISSSVTFSQPLDSVWLPLKPGNIWQRLNITTYDGTRTAKLELMSISSDSIIFGGEIFYSYLGTYMRYTPDHKILILEDDTVNLFMDFNLPEDSTFISHYGGAKTVKVIEGFERFQGLEDIKFKGFWYEPPTLLGLWGYYHFVKGYGLSSYLCGGARYWETTDIHDYIQGIIKDNSGNEIQKPGFVYTKFTLTPVTSTDTLNFTLNFKLEHEYNRLNNFIIPVVYLDKIYFISYYSFNDSLATLSDTLSFPAVTSNIDYQVERNLNGDLYKNGWMYNYKIVTKDKGIIPLYSSSPALGYYRCRWSGPTNSEDGSDKNLTFRLLQNFPNPFNSSTKISYSLAASEKVSIKVYDALGREVITLINKYQESGYHELDFNAGSLPSGIYIYRLLSGKFSASGKMSILR